MYNTYCIMIHNTKCTSSQGASRYTKSIPNKTVVKPDWFYKIYLPVWTTDVSSTVFGNPSPLDAKRTNFG